ncbi:MAG: GNVR domain-containing protein [Paracoccaceae bacterium]
MKNDILFYTKVFLSRIHYFLAVFLLVASAAIAIAKILPPVYFSESQLLVESAKIPTGLAESTVQTGALEELQIIEQRLMTRVNLLKIAREFDIFEDVSKMPADNIVKLMRLNTKIGSNAGRGQATLMTVGFSSENGQKSARVVNRFVTLILSDSVENRVSRAGATLEFFEVEVERLGGELEIQSAVILEFQNNNAGALPDTLAFRLSQQSVFQERLSSVERQIASLTEQRRRLVEIFNATGRLGAGTTTSPEQQILDTLQDDLRRALAVYSSENPKVKLIEAQIVQQEAIVTGQGAATPDSTQSPMSVLDINLADIDARIDLFGEQKRQITLQLNSLISSIEKTAENSILLDAFNRDYSNTQRQYNTAVDGLSKAATGERIELLSQGQTIVVIDPATAPTSPTSPNRKLIVVMGIAIGAALGMALVVFLELLDSSIRRPSEITTHLGITPLVTIPYIQTPMELVIRRATIIGVFAVLVIGVPATLFAVHQYYMPLDLIYDRIAEKLFAVI